MLIKYIKIIDLLLLLNKIKFQFKISDDLRKNHFNISASLINEQPVLEVGEL